MSNLALESLFITVVLVNLGAILTSKIYDNSLSNPYSII